MRLGSFLDHRNLHFEYEYLTLELQSNKTHRKIIRLVKTFDAGCLIHFYENDINLLKM